VTTSQGVKERLGYLFLADDINQSLGAPPTIKDLRSHFIYYTLYGVLFLESLGVGSADFWCEMLTVYRSARVKKFRLNIIKSQLYNTSI
jgi:hypothetical protein